MSDHASRLPAPRVCNEANEAIKEGLRQLAAHLKRPEGVMPTIIDALVADVAVARARAAEFYTMGKDTENEKLLLVAAKYDEMILNTDIRMLELGVKAASNEQHSVDRQLHIDAYRAVKSPEVAIPLAKSSDELDKLSQRQQLLAAAQRTATTKDAEFTETQPFRNDDAIP